MKTKQLNNRPKSKNNPHGKPNVIKTDWPAYNKRRNAEGLDRNKKMALVADKARELLGIEKGKPDRRVSAILISILKSENKCSYWDLIRHFNKYPNDLEVCELKRKYCRAWYQLRISEIEPVILQKIVAWMGEDDAYGTLMTDTSGFSVSAYKEWFNAKYGDLDIKMFDKMSILQSLRGKICAVEIIDGNANDSPSLRRLLSFLPPGTGAEVLADSAYSNKLNCAAVAKTGRTPIMMPKSNSVIKEFGAYATMLRFREEHPGTFYKKLGQRNNVESAFSAIKARFGGFVRALKKSNRAIELLSMTICYNMTF